MKAMTALLRREFLEHRGAFLYTPAILLSLMTLFILAAMITGHQPAFTSLEYDVGARSILQVVFGGIAMLWSAYLLIVLYFYYADSFSADTRNNAILFWKSMPQSDLKILTSKALAGLTIFPALILGFALLTMVIAYLLSFPISARLMGVLPVANPLDMLIVLVTTGISAAVIFLLTVIWYAPFLALVAGLSTLVKRWAIPAAILLVGVVTLSEGIVTFGQRPAHRPIADYLAYRAESFASNMDPMPALTSGDYMAPFQLLGQAVSRIDWAQMGIGVLFAVLVVWGASEYRRRRIDN